MERQGRNVEGWRGRERVGMWRERVMILKGRRMVCDDFVGK